MWETNGSLLALLQTEIRFSNPSTLALYSSFHVAQSSALAAKCMTDETSVIAFFRLLMLFAVLFALFYQSRKCRFFIINQGRHFAFIGTEVPTHGGESFAAPDLYCVTRSQPIYFMCFLFLPSS